METTIYYFTGTGNSLKIAKDLAKRIENSELVPMARFVDQDHIVAKAQSVGFVHPLYYYGLPRLVSEFIEKIDLGGVNYLFSVITSGFPNGMGLKQTDELLAGKGKMLDAGFYVKMPTNYIIGFNPPAGKAQQKLFERAENKVQRIVDTVSAREKRRDRESVLYNMVTRAVPAYKAWVGEVHASDTQFVVGEKCNACGTCEQVCPVGNIKMENGSPCWQHRCEQCLACINLCPKQAIEYGDKTVGRGRYRQPEVGIREIMVQNEQVLPGQVRK